ncbi:MAG: efflux RND transporter periplasmic adaptor subunit [Bacteroidaceae bacterium]|nr:efflux RND transporter periplasmic adaptor subunit [Bacteroidaceae bacterium]
MNKRIVPMLLLIGIACLAGCGKRKESVPTQAEKLPIEVALPTVKDVILTRQYPGYLSADAAVDVVCRVNGQLTQSNVSAGQRVRQGDVLYLIEPTPYRDAVLQAEATLKTAEAELAYAQSSYQRMLEVIKSEAVSEIQLLQAEANVEKAEASVHSAKASLNTARTNLGYCHIKAPIDGQITKGNYSVGAYIPGGGSPMTMATIYKDDFMYANFTVADNQWLRQLLVEELTKHSPDSTYYVTVGLGEGGGLKWQAKLDYLSPNVSTTTGTLDVRAELLNPNHLLKAGSYVTITLPVGKMQNATLIPDASIGTDQLGKYIYVVSDSGTVHYRPIVIGELIDDTLRIVKSGLYPTEYYVTQALMKVHEGMKIVPVISHSKSH